MIKPSAANYDEFQLKVSRRKRIDRIKRGGPGNGTTDKQTHSLTLLFSTLIFFLQLFFYFPNIPTTLPVSSCILIGMVLLIAMGEVLAWLVGKNKCR